MADEERIQLPVVLDNEKQPAAGTISSEDVKEMDEFGRLHGWARRQAAAELIKLGLKASKGER